MEAYALYSYSGFSDNQLSFDKGSTVKILSEKDPDWYQAEQYGQEGYAPATYIQFIKPLWYRNVTKAEAVALLNKKKGKTPLYSKGAFLVRPSESGVGDLSITVKMNSIEHFKVMKENGEYFIWRADAHFSSIDQLIDYYRQKSMSYSEKIVLRDMKLSFAVVEYDYKARSEEEIDIYAREIVTLFDDSDGDWWNGQVDRDGVTHRGCFPASYVSRK